MHFPSPLFLSTLLLPILAHSLNIIVNNDDGFGAANVREFYRLLKKAGHEVRLVAPVDNESGQGGRAVFTTEPKLTKPSEFNLVPAGAPSFGTDPKDSHIWYYNGTPAATTFFALDYVVPEHTNWKKVDLLVAGPNFGLNQGPFLYTLSGTIGATYAAVERGIPAIAFSAGNAVQRSYKELNKTTPTGHPDPATIDAQLSVKLVEQIIKSGKHTRGGGLLPQAYGINVNYPTITSLDNDSCINPPFIHSRLTGGATIDRAVLNDSTGLFTYENETPPEGQGLNVCVNGDCNLPGETQVVSKGCFTAVSVFSVDYDAPDCGPNARRATEKSVREGLGKLVKYQGLGKRTVEVA